MAICKLNLIAMTRFMYLHCAAWSWRDDGILPVLLVLTSGSTRGTIGRKLVAIVVPRAVMIWLRAGLVGFC